MKNTHSADLSTCICTKFPPKTRSLGVTFPPHLAAFWGHSCRPELCVTPLAFWTLWTSLYHILISAEVIWLYATERSLFQCIYRTKRENEEEEKEIRIKRGT